MLGLLALPSESLFLVAANAASAAGFLLGRFFVEALLIGVRLVNVRIGLLEQLVVRGLSGIEMNFNSREKIKIRSPAPIRMMMSPYNSWSSRTCLQTRHTPSSTFHVLLTFENIK